MSAEKHSSPLFLTVLGDSHPTHSNFRGITTCRSRRKPGKGRRLLLCCALALATSGCALIYPGVDTVCTKKVEQQCEIRR